MNKYLFTDGTNGVLEVHSKNELLSLINSASDLDKARVWIFSSNEWIACSSFLKQNPDFKKLESADKSGQINESTVKKERSFHPFKKSVFVAGAITGALLIFNFTNAKWEKATPLIVTAARSPNVPVMNLDSLISEIELIRGKSLDKSTRYNLRMRNNWPESILLQLKAEREVKNNHFRFFNISLNLDNASGFILDDAQVNLYTWSNGKANLADTILFHDIRYDKILLRKLTSSYKGDSLSASFKSIKSKAFNFCYSAETKNKSGNYNDRWFCRDGKMQD